MVELHTSSTPITGSFKVPRPPIPDAAFSIDDDSEVAKARALFGEMKQPLHKFNVHSSLSSALFLRSINQIVI
jgi:hypothetical protein